MTKIAYSDGIFVAKGDTVKFGHGWFKKKIIGYVTGVHDDTKPYIPKGDNEPGMSVDIGEWVLTFDGPPKDMQLISRSTK